MTVEKISGHWLTSARKVVSPNQDDRPPATATDLIVLHCISLPPGEFGTGAIDRLFCNSLDPSEHPFFQQISHLRVSAHLCIARDGSVTQYVPFDRRAWHAGDSSYRGHPTCNDYSIGIELEGTDSTPFAEIQYTRLNAVLGALFAAYPTLSAHRIAAHSEVAPHRKTDPGKAFEWARLLQPSAP